jgi:hypothetical protein
MLYKRNSNGIRQLIEIKINECFSLIKYLPADSIIEINSFCNPQLFEIIKKRIYTMPLWSGFVFKKLQSLEEYDHNVEKYGLKHSKIISNAPVESFFSFLKKINSNKNQVTMSKELIKNFYQTLLSKYENNYGSKANQFSDKGSKENIKAIEDSSNSSSENSNKDFNTSIQRLESWSCLSLGQNDEPKKY